MNKGENDRELKVSVSRAYESSVMEEALGDAFRPGGLELTARLAEVARVSGDSHILDLACGKGTTACFLSRQYGCHVVGIDLSTLLLSLAQAKAEVEEVANRPDLVASDAESLPFKDSVFDIVISECSLSLFPNKRVGIREINRVLKRGGKLAITDMFLRGKISEEVKTEAAFAFCVAGAESIEGYIKLFEQGGFKDPYFEDHSEEIRKIAYRIFINYGSFRKFSDQLDTSSVACSRGCSAAKSSTVWQRLFKEGKPGYALIMVTKA